MNKPSGKKILNTTFYPDQKKINKFINGKSELKGNKQVKTKNLKLENAKNIVRMKKGCATHDWVKSINNICYATADISYNDRINYDIVENIL